MPNKTLADVPLNQTARGNLKILGLFVTAGACVGVSADWCEAGLRQIFPALDGFVRLRAAPAGLFLAVRTDAAFFALFGACLGGLVVVNRRRSAVRIALQKTMKVPSQPGVPQRGGSALFARFSLAGAYVGIGVGVFEAALLYLFPSVQAFSSVDATYVIWFLAVLADLLVFWLFGSALGCYAAATRLRSQKRIALLAAVLMSMAGAWIEWTLHFLQAHTGDPQLVETPKIYLYPLVKFALVFVAVVVAGRLAWRYISFLFDPGTRLPLRGLAKALVPVLLLLVSGLGFYKGYPWAFIRRVQASAPPVRTRPNLILITMDTVRADHLSCYGYGRRTTPNFDRLASQGVLFENAIAPASWTLPSLASIFTGLLPHQHGGNAFRTVNPSLTTLAEVLEDHGYQTAGFNANYFYGQKGWGIGQGFVPYDDDRTSVEYNLARTLVGRTAVQPIFQKFDRFDVFFRRPAAEINDDVLRWYRNRSSRPFFLYINYLDTHAPYLPPAPYDHRFGTLSDDLARLTFRIALHPPASMRPEEKASLIAGYDNSLAYLDAQIGKLMESLSHSPDWTNTIVIITSDHGEAFGEHGMYTHGCDLHREEIHVPLIIFGRGIPMGKRIASVVPIRSLFATSLHLAFGKDFSIPAFSLVRCWESDFQPAGDAGGAVSELSTGLGQTRTGLISLTTPEWHYIHTAKGGEELYSWKTDPGEKLDLSALPEYQGTMHALHANLRSLVEQSLPPWLGREYTLALRGSGETLVKEPSFPNERGFSLLPGPRRIGTAQALFGDTQSIKERGHVPSQEELLKSLPYQ
jgi:arylsulfatase A-like enzyme